MRTSEHYIIFKTSANVFSIKYFGLWSIVLFLVYTDTVFVHTHTDIRAYGFMYGINVYAFFTLVP